MSRGRDHHESDRSLGQHVKAELQGLLRMLLKNTVSHPIRLLEGEVPWTTFHLPVATNTVSPYLGIGRIRISPDAISRLKVLEEYLPYYGNQLLNASKIKVHQGQTFARQLGDPAFCKPVGLFTQAIPAKRLPLMLQQEKPKMEAKTLPVGLPSIQDIMQNPTRHLPVPSLTTGRKSINLSLKTNPKSRMVMRRFLPAVKTDIRFRQLPLQKSPVPLHRFSLMKRQVFRQALAAKSGCAADNVQLATVFERMAMARYGSLKQDPQGNLLCNPKTAIAPENPAPGIRHDRAMSRPSSLYGRFGKENEAKPPTDTELAYLVIGIRLDTKQEIRALVPVSQLSQLDDPTQADGVSPNRGGEPFRKGTP